MSTWIVTDRKRYYEGIVSNGQPVCTGDLHDAMELDDSEIADDFPNGLPEGWVLVPAGVQS